MVLKAILLSVLRDGISETVVQPDLNTNNILISPETQQFTIIDLGELAISHQFFSLHNFLYTATIHHGVKEHDLIWHQMINACIENWLGLWPKAKFLDGYMLSKLHAIHSFTFFLIMIHWHCNKVSVHKPHTFDANQILGYMIMPCVTHERKLYRLYLNLPYP